MDSKNEAENIDKIKYCRGKRIAQYSDRRKRLYHRSLSKGLRSAAIKSFCYECVGTRDDILHCQGYGCSLYFKRPYQFEDTQLIREKIKNEETYPLAKMTNPNLGKKF